MALLKAAIDHVRQRGGKILEDYPGEPKHDHAPMHLPGSDSRLPSETQDSKRRRRVRLCDALMSVNRRE